MAGQTKPRNTGTAAEDELHSAAREPCTSSLRAITHRNDSVAAGDRSLTQPLPSHLDAQALRLDELLQLLLNHGRVLLEDVEVLRSCNERRWNWGGKTPARPSRAARGLVMAVISSSLGWLTHPAPPPHVTSMPACLLGFGLI